MPSACGAFDRNEEVSAAKRQGNGQKLTDGPASRWASVQKKRVRACEDASLGTTLNLPMDGARPLWTVLWANRKRPQN